MTDPIVGELVRELEPILIPIAVSAVGAAVTFAFATVSRWTGGKIAADAAFEAKVQAAAENEAGVLIAAASDNLATKSIKIGSPEASAVIAGVVNAIPELQTATGWTNERIAKVAVGAIGKLQASMTSAAPSQAAPAK